MGVQNSQAVISQASNRIALIMPVYNEAETIENTVRELYEKVVTKMDCVSIWDFEDGSTDETKKVLSELKDKFSDFHTEIHHQDKNIV